MVLKGPFFNNFTLGGSGGYERLNLYQFHFRTV